MRLPRLLIFGAVFSLLIFIGWRWRGVAPIRATAAASPASSPSRAIVQSGSLPTGANSIFARNLALRHLAYAQAWEQEMLREMAAFREWTSRYRAAAPAMRVALESEGVALALARRPVMLKMIKADPEHALAVTVPAALRQILPAGVLTELETRVAGAGDVAMRGAVAEAGSAGAPPPMRRRAFVGGATYTAHTYGRREPQLTKLGTSLHGIAIDGELALHESALRVLEPGETVANTPELHCPISRLAVEPPDPDAPVNAGALTFVEVNGRTVELCATTDDMVETLAQRLADAEDQAAPRVAPLTSTSAAGTPPIAADAPAAWTTGPKTVLVIRVDFSDVPGESIASAAAQTVMDSTLKPYFESASYGQTTLVSTVSTKLYRMPQTAASYATADNDSGLHSDARTAAGADYNVASFDRVIVVFANIGTSRFSGSQFTFSGLADVHGPYVWINGTFGLRPVAHELGHTYGLEHANLWEVTDNNPLSAAGRSMEYFDPFDTMNSGSTDTRFDYGPWAKNRLGWLPDSAVTTVTASGTYRVYRFDSSAASATQPLALRVFRDGVRWYWIALRQNFTTNTSITNGANVTWGFANRQQSQLLDLTPPYYTGATAPPITLAAGLAVGATLTDPDYGITIKPIALGGASPAQYIDVQITVPAAMPNAVTAWGRDGILFYDTTTGNPISAEPETFVPTNLGRVAAVAAGDLHALALSPGGSITAWGDNTNGQITVPAGLAANVAAVAAGGNVSGVVKLDGTVQLWGEANNGVTTPPVGLTTVKQLAIGGSHSVGTYHALALKTNGTVVAWGSNSNGQLNVPAGLTNVVAVAASDRLSVALKADGTVVRWGVTFTGAVAFPTGLSGVTAIATCGGAGHVLALKNDGTVVVWGNNSNGQATVPAGLTNVIAVATGSFHSLALKNDGTVVAWGGNGSGQTNIPPSLPRGFAMSGGLRASFLLAGPHVYFTSPLADQTAPAGTAVTFAANAVGGGTLAYQWRKDGVAISGATASTLTLTGVAAGVAGNYDVIVTDAGSASTLTSFPAKLTVTAALPPGVAADPGRLVNLSILTNIATAVDSFTMGVVTGGTGTSGTKPLLVRAAGPSLGALGVPGTLADPNLEFFAGSTKIGENDNWGGLTTLSNAFTAVGAFPYAAASSKDAAIFNAAVVPGSNSVKVTGVGGATGTVIAELYDSTPAAAFTTATPRLINVSVLKDVGTGFTIGFVVGGSTSRKVLVRAVGPGLAAVGVPLTAVVADPKLTLFAGSTKIDENDNWGGTAALAAAMTQVGAFALTGSSKDAALLATLQPGSYSVQVSGTAGGTGLVIAEVYEVP